MLHVFVRWFTHIQKALKMTRYLGGNLQFLYVGWSIVLNAQIHNFTFRQLEPDVGTGVHIVQLAVLYAELQAKKL